jgi:glycosyltransferase involved in cell wall biosynthesis
VNDQLAEITTLIVNYRTLDYLTRCIESFIRIYPQQYLLVIDNGSHDESTEYIHNLLTRFPQVSAIFNEKNINHGPAMDQGIHSIQTPYIFILDSDCEVLRGGFLEAMSRLFITPHLYAAGCLQHQNWCGFAARKFERNCILYVHPHAMFIDRQKYMRLAPFVHHGSPCLRNMVSARDAGYSIVHFPVGNYIHHIGRGTCSRYGYNLSPVTFLQGILYEMIPDQFAKIGVKNFMRIDQDGCGDRNQSS